MITKKELTKDLKEAIAAAKVLINIIKVHVEKYGKITSDDEIDKLADMYSKGDLKVLGKEADDLAAELIELL